MKEYTVMGIAVDNHCAIEFIDKKYKVISAKPGRKAYKIYKKGVKVIVSSIKELKEYKPLKELYAR